MRPVRLRLVHLARTGNVRLIEG